jgi:sterol carrier protein 2
MVHSPLTKLQCCPTSDGGAAAVLASEDFVRERGLEARAVEILGIEMATDLPSSFEDKSCIKVVFSLNSMVEILRLRYSVPAVRE